MIGTITNQKAPRGYTRLARFDLQAVLPYIGKSFHKFAADERMISVKLANQRMLLIGRTQKCECCKLEGTHFWLEHSGYYSPHFNLYGINGYGHEVMMTVDHINPRSKGGTLTPDNVQLLCSRCNSAKRNDPLTIEELWQRVFAAKKYNVPAFVGEWVVQGTEHGQIMACQSGHVRVRLWCPCMTATGRSRESKRIWKYNTFRSLAPEEIWAVKAVHDDCPFQFNYGKHLDYLSRAVGHMKRPTYVMPFPRMGFTCEHSC